MLSLLLPARDLRAVFLVILAKCSRPFSKRCMNEFPLLREDSKKSKVLESTFQWNPAAVAGFQQALAFGGHQGAKSAPRN